MTNLNNNSSVKTVPVQGGAQYAMVVNRVHKFVEDHATGQILTEIVKDEDGHVIFKAHAVIDGIIRGTGHAHELEGSSNINKTSHYESCETSAVGRALAMCGYMPSGQVASYEEVENAKLQQSNIAEHVLTLASAVAYVSTVFIMAIDNEDEESILEILADFKGNKPLKTAVWKTLSPEQAKFMTDRAVKIADAKKEKKEDKHERNVEAASNFAKKNAEV